MRFLILAYNYKYVDAKLLDYIKETLEQRFSCLVLTIPHCDSNAEPVYSVQLADTVRQ